MTAAPPRKGITRRDLVTGAAALGVGIGLDEALAGGSTRHLRTGSQGVTESAAVPFYGAHQAGIATPAQDYLHFAVFDLVSEAPSDLRALLERWSEAAAALARGALYDPQAQPSSSPPQDPGEALDLDAAALTITIGLGPSVFRPGTPLAARKPPPLNDLPAFRGESIEAARSGGALCVQACANDPQVAFHAVHLLARLGSATATLRWSQPGFGRTSSTSRAQATPRNLMGFKDGTDNIRAEDLAAMERFVWVQPGDGPSWMAGGTYLIVKRIRILFDVWDTTSLEGQERAVGRAKVSGAPLGERAEYDPVNLNAVDASGALAIPADAHIRLASPANNGGERILRRGYSYAEPAEPGSGAIDAGLFFIVFQRDPERQFIPLQRRLAAADALNRHIVHTSSAIFACPPGASQGGFVGEGLFA